MKIDEKTTANLFPNQKDKKLMGDKQRVSTLPNVQSKSLIKIP